MGKPPGLPSPGMVNTNSGENTGRHLETKCVETEVRLKSSEMCCLLTRVELEELSYNNSNNSNGNNKTYAQS